MKKKGFTLIEMLVVIAIIAVLVAITIPTVVKQSNKAAAAANAANLRSAYAAFVTEQQMNPSTLSSVIGLKYLVAENEKFTVGNLTVPAPSSKKVETSNVTINANLPMKAYITEDSVFVFYLSPSYEHMFFADIINKGEAKVCPGWKDSDKDSLCDNCGRPGDVHIMDGIGEIEQDLCSKGIHPDIEKPYCQCDVCAKQLEHTYFNQKCIKCGYKPESCAEGSHTDNTHDCICDNCNQQMEHDFGIIGYSKTCSNCGKSNCDKGYHSCNDKCTCVYCGTVSHTYSFSVDWGRTCTVCGTKK